MKSRGLDQAIIEAATKRNVTVVGICGGYQILGKQLDGTIAPDLPIIGTYVHGLFDSPEILRRLLNTTAETHNLPKPLVTEFSMEAEYDRLAQTVRESIDMNLINSLIE